MTDVTYTMHDDILVQLNIAIGSNRIMSLDERFMLLDAHDEIQRLRWQVERLSRPWWKRLWLLIEGRNRW